MSQDNIVTLELALEVSNQLVDQSYGIGNLSVVHGIMCVHALCTVYINSLDSQTLLNEVKSHWPGVWGQCP